MGPGHDWVDDSLESVPSVTEQVARDLTIDPAAAEAFVKKYGPVYGAELVRLQPTYDVRLPEKIGPGPHVIKPKQLTSGGEFQETVPTLTSAQFTLRQAWTANTRAISELADALQEGFTVSAFEILPNYGSRRSGEVLLETEQLWRYISYLFLFDHAEKRTGVCDRQDCPTPYFIRQRKGQKYCSHECAVLENVRRFRADKKTSKKRGH